MNNKRTFLLAAAGAGALLAFLLLHADTLGRGYRSIPMEQAVRMLETESGWLVADVRTPEEYENGHIPDAVNMPLDEIQAGHVDALPDKDQPLMVYCYTGRRSKAASEALAKLGYRNICNIGGIVDWPGEITVEDTGETVVEDTGKTTAE